MQLEVKDSVAYALITSYSEEKDKEGYYRLSNEKIELEGKFLDDTLILNPKSTVLDFFSGTMTGVVKGNKLHFEIGNDTLVLTKSTNKTFERYVEKANKLIQAENVKIKEEKERRAEEKRKQKLEEEKRQQEEELTYTAMEAVGNHYETYCGFPDQVYFEVDKIESPIVTLSGYQYSVEDKVKIGTLEYNTATQLVKELDVTLDCLTTAKEEREESEKFLLQVRHERLAWEEEFGDALYSEGISYAEFSEQHKKEEKEAIELVKTYYLEQNGALRDTSFFFAESYHDGFYEIAGMDDFGDRDQRFGSFQVHFPTKKVREIHLYGGEY